MASIVLSSKGREPRAIRVFAEALESHSAFRAHPQIYAGLQSRYRQVTASKSGSEKSCRENKKLLV
jgi:hypothetical protein